MTRIAPLVGLIALLAACSSEPGVEYRDTTLPLVDIHLHTGEWENIPPSTQNFLAERFPFPLGLDAEGTASGVLSADGVLSELDKAGAHIGLLLAVYAPRSVGVTTNEFVIKQIATAPERLYGLASVRVDRWAAERDEQLAALDAALDHPNMIGVKLAHAHQHFRMDDPDYFGIYEVAAAHDAPVYLHTGPSPFPGTSADPPYTDPAFLEAAIVAHPDTVFILGHMGFDFVEGRHGTLETCLSLASAHPNVYLEPSAFGSPGGDPDQVHLPHALARTREEGLVDRLIYGSDGPQSPGFTKAYAERTLYALDQAGWSVDDARAALSGNFHRVFGVPEASP